MKKTDILTFTLYGFTTALIVLSTYLYRIYKKNEIEIG